MDESKFSPPPISPAPRYPAGKREVIFFAAILPSSIFLWNAILYGGFNLGFSIGSVAVILSSIWYLRSCGFRFDRYTGALTAFSLIIAAGFAVSSAYLKFFMLLMLLFTTNLCFCLVTGQNRRGSGGLSSLLDAPRAYFIFGFGGMAPAIRGLNDARKNAGSAGKKGGAVLLGLVTAVPVVAVMITLLMKADAAFEGLMALLPKTDWTEPVISLLFGGFAGWILYARGTGLRHKEKAVPRKRTFRGISPITVNILLVSVCALYCVYLFSQLAYLGGGFSGILPQGYTLAQYARRGFFEMAWLSAINLCLVCCAMGLTEHASRLTKGLCLFLGLVSLFLIAAASGKMFLYIGSYGLTRLRVLTEIFMVWLAVTTVLVCVRLFRPGFPYMRPVVIAALLLGSLTFWVDMDAQIAKFNVRAYQSGKLETIDTAHLSSLRYGAWPYIEELTKDADPDVAAAARAILKNTHFQIEGFQDWNLGEARARKIADAYADSLPDDIP